MAFQTSVGDEIEIGGVTYEFGPHPAAPALPYGQEGRQGVVYQLRPKGSNEPQEWKALKVFRPKFRTPSLVYQSETFQLFAELPGLAVCERLVLTPEKHTALLKEHNELLYAVAMPWIDGPTWMDILLEKEELTPAQCKKLALSLAKVLSVMEQRGLAHCDLSAPNVLLPILSETGVSGDASPVQLVDVEGLYSLKLDKPDILPGGSPGYAAHRTAPSGLWGHQADRFAGAVLLAEMLAWADPEIRENAWAESYFDPGEMQQPGKRYDLMIQALRKHASESIVRLFMQAWQSEELHQCPTFGEWLMNLMEFEGEEQQATVQQPVSPANRAPEPQVPPTNNNIGERVDQMLEQGKKLEDAKDWEGALTVYREVLNIIPVISTQAQELQIIMSRIEMMLGNRPIKPLEQPNDLSGGEQVATGQDAAVVLETPQPNRIPPNDRGNPNGPKKPNQANRPTQPNQPNRPGTKVKKPRSGVKTFFLTVGWVALSLFVLFMILVVYEMINHPAK